MSTLYYFLIIYMTIYVDTVIHYCDFYFFQHNVFDIFFIIYIRQRSPLTPCDIIVASAAPDTPSLNTMINVRSSIIFKILEKTRKRNDVEDKKEESLEKQILKIEEHNRRFREEHPESDSSYGCMVYCEQ